jgi:hypothetical protein
MITLLDAVRSQCEQVPHDLIDLHFRRLPLSYFERWSPAEIARHLRLLARIGTNNVVEVEIRPLAANVHDILVVGQDHSGTLACITAALAALGLNLEDVHAASYFSSAEEARAAGAPDLFVVVLRMSGTARGRSPAELADELRRRLLAAFAYLAQGNLLEAQAAAAHPTPHPHDPTRSTPPASLADHQGLILGGDFRLERKIATGGMSEVWIARQLNLDRMVVVKLVRHDAALDEDVLTRFYQEGLILGQFNCANIVQVLAAGSAPGRVGRLGWMAMEFMAGGDLARWRGQHGNPPTGLAVRWLRDALEGLLYAHRRSVLHRDLKPHNLLLTADGTLKVSDFGLLKMAVKSATGLTPRSAIVGTPHYMSPEQALGEPVDERSDIFSLGTTFFHFLSGRLPFDKDTPTAVLVQIAQESAPSLTDVAPQVPRPLALLVQRMMARRREDRYQDVAVILEDLASYERRGLLETSDRTGFVPASPTSADPQFTAETMTYEPAPNRAEDVVF